MTALYMFIIWMSYCILEGMRDAYMYNIRDYFKENDVNEHHIFTIQRTLILGLFAYIYIPMIIIGPLAFSFFHNGTYYSTRNWLDDRIYPGGWFSQSRGSSSKLTDFFTPTNRTLLFVLSIITVTVLILKDKL